MKKEVLLFLLAAILIVLLEGVRIRQITTGADRIFLAYLPLIGAWGVVVGLLVRWLDQMMRILRKK